MRTVDDILLGMRRRIMRNVDSCAVALNLLQDEVARAEEDLLQEQQLLAGFDARFPELVDA